MSKVHGNTQGLKSKQLRLLGNLYRRRVPREFVVTPELAKDLTLLSAQIRRQIGLLLDRMGRVAFVIVGTPAQIMIPDLSEYRYGTGRLKGLRLVHTHLKGEALTDDDLSDLMFLSLDMVAAVTIGKNDLPDRVYLAHLLPEKSGKKAYEILEPKAVNDLDMDCAVFIRELEREIGQATKGLLAKQSKRAFIVSVSTLDKKQTQDSLDELKELCRTSGLEVTGTMVQYRERPDSRYLMGRGKLNELAIASLEKGAGIVVFDQDLNPSQIRSITDRIELPVIDRTQLILDIFAQRAMTREGKLQVELAQLKYMLPRLVGKSSYLSRLMGGIGGRGPGETKLEIDRRRARERVTRLEKALGKVQDHRKVQRSKRDRYGLPVVSIVGYTNAGKSTLLNTLTKAKVLAENKLFATLDPTSRRLKFPHDRQVIITDTVGFIKNLPRDLVVAFRATLEELESADLLLHVIDASNPRMEEQIRSVEKTLADLKLDEIPVIRVLNKIDLISEEKLVQLQNSQDAVFIQAPDRKTFSGLMERIEEIIEEKMPQWKNLPCDENETEA